MRVFVLCTGRTGSAAFIEACKYISNYTCGHESRSNLIGDERFDYPDNHIEADNRLSWQLGRLEEKFGDDPVYVHLIRNKQDTAKSFSKRFFKRRSIIKAYSEGVMMTPPELLHEDEMLEISMDYYDAVNANIRLFLRDKSKKIRITLKDIKREFPQFWTIVGAKGDLDSALRSFDIMHNTSAEMKNENLYRIKLWLLGVKRFFAKK